jgi:tRNA threonylcarbamoyladenosine biosynthesis protein TsaB
MPMVQTVMNEAAVEYAALDAIAVTRGPGTFTGLRIGLAAARGLALAAELPLFGLTTLEVIAAEAGEQLPDHPVLVAIDARRGQVYAQLFEADGLPVGEPRAMTLDAAVDLAGSEKIVFAGDMAGQMLALSDGRGVVASGSGQPDAAVLARCAARRPMPVPGLPVSPLYLRAPDATLPGDVNSTGGNR